MPMKWLPASPRDLAAAARCRATAIDSPLRALTTIAFSLRRLTAPPSDFIFRRRCVRLCFTASLNSP